MGTSGGDVGGGGTSGGGVSGDDAVWRDLVARYDMITELDLTPPWPEQEDLRVRQPDQPESGQAQPGQAQPGQAQPGQAQPGQAQQARETARVIRRASAPAPRPTAEDGPAEEDEHFIPPPPPPLPHLDPVAKGAWLALLGGPAYLLTASMTGWYVPGWAALTAVVAFVAGLAVIVIRLGDGPSRGAGPGGGAIL